MRLLFRREGINDPIDGLRRVDSMKRSEYEVSGFRGSDGRANGFRVAQFPDQNNVGILSQSMSQRLCERTRVAANFALLDDAPSVGKHELDRILYGDDHTRKTLADIFDH